MPSIGCLYGARCSVISIGAGGVRQVAIDKAGVTGGDAYATVEPRITSASLDADIFSEALHVANARSSLRLVHNTVGKTSAVRKVHGGGAEVDEAEGVTGVGTGDGEGALTDGRQCTSRGAVGKREHSITFLSARFVEDGPCRHCALFAIGSLPAVRATAA